MLETSTPAPATPADSVPAPAVATDLAREAADLEEAGSLEKMGGGGRFDGSVFSLLVAVLLAPSPLGPVDADVDAAVGLDVRVVFLGGSAEVPRVVAAMELREALLPAVDDVLTPTALGAVLLASSSIPVYSVR